MCFLFLRFGGLFYEENEDVLPKRETFEDGFKEYILDCKARNLRDGTIHHYQESIKQIYKRIPPDTPISSMNKQTMTDFYIALREDPNLNEVSMGTYARDLKTLMRFFMKCQYIPHFEIQLSKFVVQILYRFLKYNTNCATALPAQRASIKQESKN